MWVCFIFFLQLKFSFSIPDCIAQGTVLCDADPNCSSFGLYQNEIQLHGCDNETAPNNDWIIYAKAQNYVASLDYINIDESRCAQHPEHIHHQCATKKKIKNKKETKDKPYTVHGSIDVGTLENSLFLWKSTMYVLENLGCGYIDHAGLWFPAFKGHSYARVRQLDSGIVIANISSTIGFAFISAFPDYKYNRMWLFGVDVERCNGTYRGTKVQAWWSNNLLDWKTDVAIPDYKTYNVEVSAVPKSPVGLSPHRYVMILESFGFMLNNDPDGNLTRSGSWVLAKSKAPHAPSGGPSIRFSDGFYYILTGGHNVELYRSPDLQTWQPSQYNPLIEPTPADAKIAPYAGFAASADRKGFAPMEANWTLWDWNSNDGDVCCMSPEANMSWLVWGASTQGRHPKPPVKHGSTNAIGTSTMLLPDLLASYYK